MFFNSMSESLVQTYYIPCIVTTFRIIINVIKQAAEVDKDGPRSFLGNQVGLHLLRWSIWRNCDRTLFQTYMVSLSEGLNQCCTLK